MPKTCQNMLTIYTCLENDTVVISKYLRIVFYQLQRSD